MNLESSQIQPFIIMDHEPVTKLKADGRILLKVSGKGKDKTDETCTAWTIISQ